MTRTQRHVLEAETGFRSREVALYVAQLEDLTRRLLADLEGVTPRLLEWQPRPGMNSLGMLLAHAAFYEVYWVRCVLEDRPNPIGTRDVLGIDREEVGTPLPEGAPAPAGLAGRDLAFYEDLLARARAYTYQVARSVADAELDCDVPRVNKEGESVAFTPRWALHHLVEHLAGHYGQARLLRHLWRAQTPG